MATDSNTRHEKWNLLQGPAEPAPPTSGYMLLLAALDAGWEIDGPVYLLTGVFPDYRCIYIFNLRRPLMELNCRVMVEESDAINRLLHKQKLQVRIS